MVTIDKIFHASVVLKNIIRPTPLTKTAGIAPNCDLYLKPENLQYTGSFKLRGAGYMISQLSVEERAKGVIACSAGNHAQGVALAASKCGIPSLICLPDSAPISKVEARATVQRSAWSKAFTTTPTRRRCSCGMRWATPSSIPLITKTSSPVRAPSAWRSCTR